MPLISTRGAASAQGFGEFAQSAAPVYIEDVFSTYLYTGNGSTQTITNGVDLSGKGGLVWLKIRSDASDHALYDTARGATKDLVSNSAAAQTTQSTGLTAFSGTGFSIGSLAKVNNNASTYASWTFREQAKFFDVVTYTGNGSNRTISHNLGSVPGCIIVKRTDTTADWQVYHRSLANTEYLVLNSTAAKATGTTRWNSTTPTSTEFSLGTDTTVNASGGTYVAYIFAHDAGGFGLTGSDNVISCGSYTGNGSATGPAVTLGYEPQWLLVKNATSTGDWNLIDNMRGFVVGGTDAELNPNLSDAESTGTFVTPTTTGFQVNTTNSGYNTSLTTYIYIAIRRGPMKVPTSGTSVFSRSTDSANTAISSGLNFPDLAIGKSKNLTGSWQFIDRLRGILPFPSFTTGVTSNSPRLSSDSTAAETTGSFLGQAIPAMGGSQQSIVGIPPTSLDALVGYFFRRAPGFFDVVCFTGNNGSTPFAHNLGVKPELLFIKRRNVVADWEAHFNYGSTNYGFFYLNQALAKQFDVAAPTATTFSPFSLNTNTAVAYLFATVAGVSKVGSYTGSGTTKQIDCGFTAGARFVLIKRTDSTGDWYVYDSARGIVAGNDPYLFLNSTAAEVTNTDYVDTYSAGFELSSTAPAGLNANGGTYIFLAIA